MRADDAVGDVETEAGAAVVPRQRIFDLEELLEYPALVPRVDADAVVAYGEADAAIRSDRCKFFPSSAQR